MPAVQLTFPAGRHYLRLSTQDGDAGERFNPKEALQPTYALA